MPYFDNEGVKIYYETIGSGPDLIISHGFMASLEVYKSYPWLNDLSKTNRIVLIDCRGHGKSDKPTDTRQYKKMVDDYIKLLDQLSIERANFFGYSMSGWLTLALLIKHPKRVKSAIIGGIGVHPDVGKIYEARLKALKGEKIEDPAGLMFYEGIKQLGYDLNLSLSIISGVYHQIKSAGLHDFEQTKENLRSITVPIITILGSNDKALNKDLIAQVVPGACYFQIQGRDHGSTPEDPKFYMILEAFLNYVNGR
ncbi:MAG: alpha/beta fold hydrolase [Promethearchaeota archaeon]